MAWSKVHDDLLTKINHELEIYRLRMLSRTATEVYNCAEEITAMGFCHNQLMECFHDYQAKDLEPLLEQEKPLEFLTRRWMVEQDVDLSSEFDRVFRETVCQEESDEPEPGPSMA